MNLKTNKAATAVLAIIQKLVNKYRLKNDNILFCITIRKCQLF